MPATGQSDQDLLRQARAGEDAALAVLYQRHYPAIYRFARHMSGDAALAEEAAQEVFLALLRRRDGYDPERGAVGAYLLGIARHWLARHWRQQVRWAPLAEEVTAAPGGPPEAERREAIALVRRAIAALPESYRAVVVLCEIEDQSYEAAALALNCPVGTVRSRLHRARALLARKLDPAHRSRRRARMPRPDAASQNRPGGSQPGPDRPSGKRPAPIAAAAGCEI